MLKRIEHRGNTQKITEHNGISFGHRRLAIQGLDSKYDQPSETEKKLILYNGEIFNFKELNPKLECDTELFKDRFDVQYFDGFFSLVEYEKISGKIKFQTDRFGQKQLYYKIKDGKVIGIASEIKALVTKEDTLNNTYLSRCYKFGYNFDNNLTLVEGIYRTLPGYTYSINKNYPKLCSFKRNNWDSSKLLPIRYVMNTGIYNLMNLSVKRRLISDVPISLLFSGGLDSSIILHHILENSKNNNSRNNKSRLKLFTIENSDDIYYAEKASEYFGIKLDKIKLKYKKEDYEKIHFQNESAVDLGSVMPNYNLFKAVHEKGYKVALTGDGSDEVFSGYKRNYDFDFQTSDIYDELQYYHFPRIDKLSMAHTVENRSPFCAQYIIDFAKNIPYKERINKQCLRKAYSKLLPSFIINREKTPLKIESIQKNKIEERKKLVKMWVNNFDRFKN